jgi:hypothetical protein
LAISGAAVGASPYYPGWFASKVPNNYFFGEFSNKSNKNLQFGIILSNEAIVLAWQAYIFQNYCQFQNDFIYCLISLGTRVTNRSMC